ncbi:MAG TPA: Ig-like domain-containing protein [Pyrinomonadaceae bacterium]|nr:Ig-like domain-containing protein [Pyrinomonadaceae bacterium]
MFLVHKISPSRSVLPVAGILRLLVIGVILFSLHHQAKAAGTFIAAPARVDMVYDAARDTVYITSGSSVLRYHLGSNSYLAPFELGGSLSGIDLSPDGNTLAVADRTRSANEVWIHIVDLQTGQSRKATFPRAFGEGGTFTVAFGNDGGVLISSTYEGSGWVPLRRYVPATGATSQIASSVRQDTMLTGSADRSVIGIAESNSSDGPFGRYRINDGNLLRKSGYTDGTSWFNYEMGVNRNGTQYAIPTYGGTFIYDSALRRINVMGQYAGPQPIGVVYHPAEDIVYFAWAGSTEVRAFDTNSFAQLAAYDFEHSFTSTGNWAFTQGRLKVSRDGSLLLATVNGGVRYLRLYEPLVADEQAVVTEEDTSSPVTLTGSVGNGGALSLNIAANPSHGTLSGTAPNLVYTPNADYHGTDSFTFNATYGAASASATVSITVNSVNDLPLASDQSVNTNEDATSAITLSASDRDGDALGYVIVSGPAHGALSGSGANLIYTPSANYNGNDSFTFKSDDGTADSNLATVTIAVASVNDAPVAVADTATTLKNTLVNIPVRANDQDIDGDVLTVSAVSQGTQGGTVTISGGGTGVSYKPRNNFTGLETFTYTIIDGKGGISTATVQVNVIRK